MRSSLRRSSASSPRTWRTLGTGRGTRPPLKVKVKVNRRRTPMAARRRSRRTRSRPRSTSRRRSRPASNPAWRRPSTTSSTTRPRRRPTPWLPLPLQLPRWWPFPSLALRRRKIVEYVDLAPVLSLWLCFFPAKQSQSWLWRGSSSY